MPNSNQLQKAKGQEPRVKGQFKAYLLKRGCSNRTVKTYIHDVTMFFQWAEGKHIAMDFATYSDMLEYTQYLRNQQLLPTTVKGYFKGLNHYFDYLIQAQQHTENPARYLNLQGKKHRTLYHLLSPEQLEGLYTHFDTNSKRRTKLSARASAHCKKVMVGLMIFQGLDIHAMAALSVRDLDLDKGTIQVPSSRIQAERILTLRSTQMMELYRYADTLRAELLQHFPLDTEKAPDQLLIFGSGKYAHINAFKRLLDRLKEQEPALTSSRQIKASVITHWLRQYNLREVQYMAGHRNVKNTEAYLRDDTQDLKADIDRFHPFG